MGRKRLTRQEAADLIRSSCRIVGVTFVKRSDGSLRRMACRSGVKAHLKGGTKVYDPADYSLLVVYDMNNGYRSIPVEGIKSVTVGGVIRKVT